MNTYKLKHGTRLEGVCKLAEELGTTRGVIWAVVNGQRLGKKVRDELEARGIRCRQYKKGR